MLFTAMQTAGKKKFTLKPEGSPPLPKAFFYDNRIHIDEALNWVENQVDTLVLRLDSRNGNNFYAERKIYWLSLLKEVV